MQFTVEGMRCNPCARKVANAVHKVDADASVNVDISACTVSVQSKNASTATIKLAIEEAGYRVTSFSA